jgi:hypothetical protein
MVGDEMHMVWDDGFHDVLTVDEVSGNAVVVSLGDEKEVRFRLKAEKDKRP